MILLNYVSYHLKYTHDQKMAIVLYTPSVFSDNVLWSNKVHVYVHSFTIKFDEIDRFSSMSNSPIFYYIYLHLYIILNRYALEKRITPLKLIVLM